MVVPLLPLFASCWVSIPALPTQSPGCLYTEGRPCLAPSFDVATAVIDDRLIVMGGFDGPAISALRRVTAYDPASDTWHPLADLPSLVTHAPAVVANRDIWLLGGFIGHHPGVATDEVWRYDVDADSWHVGPPLPHAVAGGAGVYLGSKLHYFGGVLADRDTGSTSHWALDLANPGQGWQSLMPLPTPRNHLAGVSWQGEIWAIGGQEGHDQSTNDSAQVDVFDDATGLWRSGPALPFPRSHVEGATFATPSTLYVVGGNGHGTERSSVNDVMLLGAGDTEWSYGPSVPHWVAGGAACTIGGELIVTCGNGLVLGARASLQKRPLGAPLPWKLRINCGQGKHSDHWCADAGSDSGRVGWVPASRDVLGTTEDGLYRIQRGGDPSPSSSRIRYRQALAPQACRVRLHFCELWHTAQGERVFDILFNGLTHESALDLIAAAGRDQALVRTFDVENASGVVELELRGLVDVPTIAGIDLEALDPLHLERRCPPPVNSSGGSAVLRLAGSTSVTAGRSELIALEVPTGTTGILLQSDGAISFPLGTGTLCVGPTLHRRSVVTATAGELRFPLQLGPQPHHAPALAAGTRWHFQAWFRDGSSFGFSDALGLQFTL